MHMCTVLNLQIKTQAVFPSYLASRPENVSPASVEATGLCHVSFFVTCLSLSLICGGLNRFGTHRLVCLNAYPIGSGTLGGAVLVEKVSHCKGQLGGLLCSSHIQCGTQSPPGCLQIKM